MNWDLKAITDLITALAALSAAVQSWRAHGESKKTGTLVTEMKTTIETSQKQTLSQQINVNVGTVGQGKEASSRPIFQQTPQEQNLPEQEPPEPTR